LEAKIAILTVNIDGENGEIGVGWWRSACAECVLRITYVGAKQQAHTKKSQPHQPGNLKIVQHFAFL